MTVLVEDHGYPLIAIGGEAMTLERLRELEAKATPGPWHFGSPFEDGCVRSVRFTAETGGTDPARWFHDRPDEHHMETLHSPDRIVAEGWAAHATEDGFAIRPADAAFIVAAVEYVRAILADTDEPPDTRPRTECVCGARILVENWSNHLLRQDDKPHRPADTDVPVGPWDVRDHRLEAVRAQIKVAIGHVKSNRRDEAIRLLDEARDDIDGTLALLLAATPPAPDVAGPECSRCACCVGEDPCPGCYPNFVCGTRACGSLYWPAPDVAGESE